MKKILNLLSTLLEMEYKRALKQNVRRYIALANARKNNGNN